MLQMITIVVIALVLSAKSEAQNTLQLPAHYWLGSPYSHTADVEREARAAFAELDTAAAKLEIQQQAEFRLLVQKELGILDLDLRKAYNDSLAEGIMKRVYGYTNNLLADETASPQIKTMQFSDFIGRVRTINGLSVDTNADTLALDEESNSRVVEATVPTRVLTPSRLDLNDAYNESNWIANTSKKGVPKKWWKLEGQTWNSKDGKVTFAVAKGQSRLIQLAHDKAEMEARLLLIGANEPGITEATLVGTQAIQWKSQRDGEYCLMAVPTELLPK